MAVFEDVEVEVK